MRGRSSVWLEHSTVTREVAGSSPVGPVRFAKPARSAGRELNRGECRGREQGAANAAAEN